MIPEFSDAAVTSPATVEALFAEAFPGDQPHPAATVTVKHAGSVEIALDGDESALFRVMALALLAATIGDEDGPEVIPGVSRYTCGLWRGVFFLITTPVDAAAQADLEAFGRRMINEIDGL